MSRASAPVPTERLSGSSPSWTGQTAWHWGGGPAGRQPARSRASHTVTSGSALASATRPPIGRGNDRGGWDVGANLSVPALLEVLGVQSDRVGLALEPVHEIRLYAMK